MRLGERGNLATYCVDPGRFLGASAAAGRRRRGALRDSRGVTADASSGFVPVQSRFSPTPRSQLSQISRISPAATLNPDAATNASSWRQAHCAISGIFAIKAPSETAYQPQRLL